jgi:hypothetical protein
MNLKELAWAAGFFDGEGHIGAGRSSLHFDRPKIRPYAIVYLKIGQTDRRPLDRFRDAVGCGAVRGPYKYNRPNNKPIWVWQVGRFERVQATVAMLWRFLSEPKRLQALNALKCYHADRAGLVA